MLPPFPASLLETQMSFMAQPEVLWCERTQDMTGCILTSPPLDEDTTNTLSTVQYENYFDVQNSENPSPEEFILGDQTEAILGDDSIMFENNFKLGTGLKTWLSDPSKSEISLSITSPSFQDEDTDFPLCTSSENPPLFLEAPKVHKKPSPSNKNIKRRDLSLFHCEEPYITEDLETFSDSCVGIKHIAIIKEEMDVAEEVEVTTQEQDCLEVNENSFFTTESVNIPKEEKNENMLTSQEDEELPTPLRESFSIESWLNSVIETGDPLPDMLTGACDALAVSRPSLPLQLDISAAMATSQMSFEALPDTPDVLRPVLNPGLGFDLVNFLTNNNDTNNNEVLPSPTASNLCFSKTASTLTKQDKQYVSDCTERRGKGRLSLSELKDRSQGHKSAPTPGPSEEVVTHVRRPVRRSAAKFDKLLQEGFLDTTDSQLCSSDEEYSAPKTKRRRTTSSSSCVSRIRQTSESDRSAVCVNDLRYREKRDRNNISSKKSRQKRKAQQELLKQELKQLELKNTQLKKKEKELAADIAFWIQLLKDQPRKK